jgi:hypothetical protein
LSELSAILGTLHFIEVGNEQLAQFPTGLPISISQFLNGHRLRSQMSSLDPAVAAEYLSRSEAKLQEILALLNDPNWKETKREPEIVFFTRTDPSSPFSQLKSIVSIPAPIEAVLQALRPIETVDAKTPKGDRHGLQERRVVVGPADDEHQSTVFYLVLESPGPLISPRDFLMSRYLYPLPDNRFAYLHLSIDNESLVPLNSKYVRGEMLFQGYLVENDPDAPGSVRLTFFVHADPKGAIPAWAYNNVVTGQGYTAKGIKKKVLKDLGQ